jgi:hypothetical protein
MITYSVRCMIWWLAASLCVGIFGILYALFPGGPYVNRDGYDNPIVPIRVQGPRGQGPLLVHFKPRPQAEETGYNGTDADGGTRMHLFNVLETREQQPGKLTQVFDITAEKTTSISTMVSEYTYPNGMTPGCSWVL